MAAIRPIRLAALFVTLGLSGLVGGGCAYSGMTSMPDGTVVLARNSMLGANRKIFVCHVVVNDLKCTESAGAP